MKHPYFAFLGAPSAGADLVKIGEILPDAPCPDPESYPPLISLSQTADLQWRKNQGRTKLTCHPAENPISGEPSDNLWVIGKW
jgi:hypothetical protein